MTKDEIKARCRKAYVVLEDGGIFGNPAMVGAVIVFKEEDKAKEALRDKDDKQDHYISRFPSVRRRTFKVCPVYMVPASKIDS